MWKVVSHLNPDANDLYLQLDQARALGDGQGIMRVTYDHKTGTHTQPVRLSPSQYIFFVGLHPFYLKNMRNLIDVKIFMDTDETVRRDWKVRRDCEKRGYTPEQVVAQMQHREADSARFIRPQREFADLTFRYFSIGDDSATDDSATDDSATGDSTTGGSATSGSATGGSATGGSANNPRLGLEVRAENGTPLDRLAAHLHEIPGVTASVVHDQDLAHQSLVVGGVVSREWVVQAASELLPDPREFLGHPVEYQGGYEGIIQLAFMTFVCEFIRSGGDHEH
jgi:hypothetical protein